jgi:hypothetical protein
MKRMTPVKKYVDGGDPTRERLWRTIGAMDLNSDPVTSALPPGAGTPIDINGAIGGNSYAWSSPGSGVIATNAPALAGTGNKFNVNWKQLGSMGQSVAPYVSNIVNSFRNAPKPAQPIMDSPPVFQRVNLDSDRVQVGREISSANTAADRTLAGNQAVSVRQFNMGQKLNELGKISQQERNYNVDQSNKQAMVNAQVAAGNNAKTEDYNQSMVERTVAQQRERSANLANAADKYVAIQNEQRKASTDVQKANILRSLYSKSGVLKRQGMDWKAQGLPDPFGQDYKWLTKQ